MAPPFELLNPPAISAPSGYSHVAKVTGGSLVFLSGQVALDAQGEVVGAGDYGRQAEQTFRNLAAALRAVGGDFRSVVKLGYFVLDLRALPEIRKVRDRYIDPARPPASTAVQVGRLFRPELLLEIEAVACLDP
jgi:enamine deaminase RidA (YjgF/YER057c/UK114 family)